MANGNNMMAVALRPTAGETPALRVGAVRVVRGFSLVEVLMAVMILGIGMIMVASVYPVGANWTRQNIEESVAGMVARNAVNIIQTKYPGGLDLTAGGVLPLPGMSAVSPAVPVLPLTERAYAFGAEPPYPAANPTQALYFWTGLINEKIGSNSFDVFILVCRKGGAEQKFPYGASWESVDSGGAANSRAPSTAVPLEDGVPYLARIACVPVGGGPTNQLKLIADGFSGLVGAQVILDTGSGDTPSVYRVIASDNPACKAGAILTVNGLVSGAVTTMWVVPPAKGESESPLVYVYQTTVGL